MPSREQIRAWFPEVETMTEVQREAVELVVDAFAANIIHPQEIEDRLELVSTDMPAFVAWISGRIREAKAQV